MAQPQETLEYWKDLANEKVAELASLVQQYNEFKGMDMLVILSRNKRGMGAGAGIRTKARERKKS